MTRLIASTDNLAVVSRSMLRKKKSLPFFSYALFVLGGGKDAKILSLIFTFFFLIIIILTCFFEWIKAELSLSLLNSCLKDKIV